MSDIHALSGAYAVDGLDRFERGQFERHLVGCPACRAEVEGLQETAALLAETTVLEPPASLRARVLADIAVTRPLPPLVAALPAPSLLKRRQGRQGPRRSVAVLMAAAAAVVAIGGGAVIVDRAQDGSSTAPGLSAADKVLQAPDAERFATAAKGGGTVTIVRSPALNQAVLMTTGLAEAPSGHTRELWLKHGTEYIPAGFLDGGADHKVLLDGDPASAQGFGLTIEPASGSTSPSDKLVALLDFTSA
jgi:hypothetical protein